MDKTASAIVEPQKQLAALTQKSNKKPKNKKTNGKVSANDSSNGISTEHTETTVKNGEKLEGVAGDSMNTANGLAEKLEKHLHIAGDGLQMNGKCNNLVDSYVSQNGHHSPASVKNIPNISTNIKKMQTDQQCEETLVVDALKKSKSKNIKQKNKDANFVCHNNDMSHHNTTTTTILNCNDNLPLQSNQVNATEAISNSTDVNDMVQMKNGFHGCVNEHNNSLPCKVTQQDYTLIDNNETHEKISPALQTNKNSKNALSTSAEGVAESSMAAILSTSNNIPTSSSTDTRLQQEQSSLITIAATNQHNKTTIVNPPTPTIQYTNNTAKQDENVIQQAVANSKTNTTQETTISVESGINTVAATTSTTTTITPALDLSNVHIEYKEYESELQMHDIMRLIQAELSEPYSIYTYRYFIYNWPKLCFLAAHNNEYVGAIVCKLDMHMNVRRGYIAMLAVRKEYRKLKIGTTLVQKAIEAMLADNADEVVLETEMRNLPALRLYENLGFVRDKRLFRYYLNGVDALRLKLWFR